VVLLIFEPEICHSVLDLLVSQASVVPQSYNTSPTTPSSPSPYPSPRTPNPFKSSGSGAIPPNSEEAQVFTAPHLTRLKIALRKQEAELKSKGYNFRKGGSSKINRIPTAMNAKQDQTVSLPSGAVSSESANGAIGKNEGTVRFLFGPGLD
jgi:CTD kinase subunit beta